MRPEPRPLRGHAWGVGLGTAVVVLLTFPRASCDSCEATLGLPGPGGRGRRLSRAWESCRWVWPEAGWGGQWPPPSGRLASQLHPQPRPVPTWESGVSPLYRCYNQGRWEGSLCFHVLLCVFRKRMPRLPQALGVPPAHGTGCSFTRRPPLPSLFPVPGTLSTGASCHEAPQEPTSWGRPKLGSRGEGSPAESLPRHLAS